MRTIGLLITGLCCTLLAAAQTSSFPKDWSGNWAGELHWFKNGSDTAQRVAMKIRIHPTDSAGTYTWQLLYGAGGEDNRPYLLVPKDTAGVHWAIDERNGIVLDQYLIGHKLCGVFTVMKNTIASRYWLSGDQLYVEFFSFRSAPVSTTGAGTEEVPSVDSYRVGGYQTAVLRRE